MKTLIPLIALLLIVGCNGVKPPLQGRNDPYRSEQILYVDEDLRDRTAIGDVKVSRTNDILYVTVPVRSTSNRTFSVDWRITFFKPNGQPMSSTAWASKTLNANTFEYFSANSLAPGAADFQLDLRYSK